MELAALVASIPAEHLKSKGNAALDLEKIKKEFKHFVDEKYTAGVDPEETYEALVVEHGWLKKKLEEWSSKASSL